MMLERQIILYIFLNCLQGFPGSSASKECACRAEDPCSIPGSGRSLLEGMGYLTIQVCLGFPGGSVGKEYTCNARDLGWQDPFEEG